MSTWMLIRPHPHPAALAPLCHGQHQRRNQVPAQRVFRHLLRVAVLVPDHVVAGFLIQVQDHTAEAPRLWAEIARHVAIDVFRIVVAPWLVRTTHSRSSGTIMSGIVTCGCSYFSLCRAVSLHIILHILRLIWIVLLWSLHSKRLVSLPLARSRNRLSTLILVLTVVLVVVVIVLMVLMLLSLADGR